MNQPLRLVGMAGRNAERSPAVHEGVGLGRKFFEEREGAFWRFVQALRFSVMKKERHDGINDHEVDEIATPTVCLSFDLCCIT